LGDSIPFWAGIRAKDTKKQNLNAPSQKIIGWWGIRGMSWSDFRHSIQCNVLLMKSPDLIIIHLGGNDLVSMSLTRLRNVIKREMKYLRDAMPDSTIIWIDIIQRLSWRAPDSEIPNIEAKRKRINRWGRQQVKLHSRSDILCLDIDFKTPGFFREDGVHLSDVGLEFYLDTVRDLIAKNL
jgi:lysophospholipase L1-like esterase